MHKSERSEIVIAYIKRGAAYAQWLVMLVALEIIYPSGVNDRELHLRFAVDNVKMMASLAIVALVFVAYRKAKHQTLRFSWLTWVLAFGLSLLVNIPAALVSNEAQAKMTGAAYLDGSSSFGQVAVTLIAIVGYTLLFARAFQGLAYVLRFKEGETRVNYWLVLVTLLAFWAFWVHFYVPGVITWDGFRQFMEYQHQTLKAYNWTYVPTNHHPWLATLIVGFLFDLGRSWFGSVNNAVLFVVVVQILINAPIFAAVVTYAFKRGGKVLGWLVYGFFAGPVVGLTMVMIDKTVLYYGFVLGFFLMYALVAETVFKHGFAKVAWWHYVLYAVFGLMMSLYRKDGAYVVDLASVLLIVFAAVKNRKALLPIAISFVAVFGLTFAWNNVYLPAKGVIPGSSGEALTIPLRQVAQQVIVNKKDFTKADLAKVDKVMPLATIEKYYNVQQADNLKTTFPVDTFIRDRDDLKKIQTGKLSMKNTAKTKREISDFMAVWKKMLLKHPIQYIEMYVQANSLYFNLFQNHPDGGDGLILGWDYMDPIDYLHPDWYDDYTFMTTKAQRDFGYAAYTIYANFPLVKLVTHTAFALWALLILLALVIVRGGGSRWLLILPALAMLGTATLSPVNGYYRYAFPALYALPILIAFYKPVFMVHKKEND